jgi:hypothetical protein
MTRSMTLLGLLAACTVADDRQLVVEGPSRVQVDELGPVDGPAFVLSDGTAPEGLTLTASPEAVARVEGGTVRAVGPGEASIEGAWNGQTASWSLVVAPRITLRLVSPPATLTVGQRQPFHVEARHGGTSMDPGPLDWRSSDPKVASVDEAGVVTGVAPGTTYIIAKRDHTEAMAELTVVGDD